MGHGLQRINRSWRGKLPVIIQEGRIRPVVPLVAAKFATECNIAVRNHVPVLKHWKDYKKKPEILTMFEGRLSVIILFQPFPSNINHAMYFLTYSLI